MTPSILAVFLVPSLASSQATEVPAPAKLRQAVERSLPYLEREGVDWINDRNCMSCHVVPFMLWSHNEAKAIGVKVDAKKLDEWTT